MDIGQKIKENDQLKRHEYRKEWEKKERAALRIDDVVCTPLGSEPDYRANCSNRLSGRIYELRGAEHTAPAFEIEEVENAELMRSKYCIKYEMGLCPNYKVRAANDAGYVNRLAKTQFTEPLFLINGKNRLELKFDCSKCEMVVIG